MQLATISTACLLALVQADGNSSSPIVVSEEQIREMQTNIQSVQEHHRLFRSNSMCSNDMRSTFPGCHQSGSMWCWATSVASVKEYYSGQRGDQCVGLECEIVGHVMNTECCPFKAPDDTCGKRGGSWGDAGEIVASLKHYTGRSFIDSKGTMPKATLDASLQNGNPIILLVGNNKGPDHVVTLHGCDGSGNYWFHDPEREYGTFIQVDYDWLVGDMCFAWVKCDTCPHHQRLEVCSGSKNPGEGFRFYRKWYSALFIPAGVIV